MNDIDIFNKIVNDERFKKEMNYIQHGDVSVYNHSINVAKSCISFSKKLGIKVNYESLVKGALLHDYFLYDWHDKEHEGLHAFEHPKIARRNAINDFGLSKKEENMILSHMFPLSKSVPKYKESIILCCVDKYCASKETITRNKIAREINDNKKIKFKRSIFNLSQLLMNLNILAIILATNVLSNII